MNFLKKTIFALMAVFTAQTMSAQPYMSERLSMEGVDIIGSVYYLRVNAYDAGEPGYYAFKYDDQYQGQYTTPLKTGYVCGGSTYHNGKIYACEYDDGAHLDQQEAHWVIYDAKTFKKINDINKGSNYALTTMSLAYDPTEDMIYAIGRTYMETYLLKIDPNTGDATRVLGKDGQPNVFDNNYRYGAIGCDNNGGLYIVYMETIADDEGTDKWHLAKVRKSTGQLSRVDSDELTVDNDVNSTYLQNDTRKQCLFTNSRTGKMYWFFPANSSNGCIAELNTKTAKATIKAYMAQQVVPTGAFFVEPMAKAPAIISDFKFVESGVGSVKGKLQFTVPAEAYDGTALSGEQTVVVKEGTKTLVNTKAEAGSVFTSDELTFTNDNHIVSVTVSNEAGDGPTVKRNFYVGYDTPLAPTNIKLVADGLKTTLTWDAPTKGKNGSAIDTDKLTYTVLRYGALNEDDAKNSPATVAEGLKECQFEETHPSDMARWQYLITPVVGDVKGKPALSSPLIVGTPLDLPYGGAFKSPFDFMNYYTVVDNNADRTTWNFAGTEAYYQYSTEQDADDWMISPALNMKKDHNYRLTFKAHSTDDSYPEAMDIYLGKDATVQAMDTRLWDNDAIEVDNGEDNIYNVDFTVPEDGIYHYGFHCYSPAYSFSLVLSDIMVYDKDVTAISSTQAANSAKVKFTTNVGGQRINGMQKGINILKMADGSVKKVVVK